MRLGDPAHGIVTKIIHKTLPGVIGMKGWWVLGVRGLGVGILGGGGVGGLEVVG